MYTKTEKFLEKLLYNNNFFIRAASKFIAVAVLLVAGYAFLTLWNRITN